MGSANIIGGQIIKGLIFLAAQTAYIFYMLRYGFDALVGLVTLGTKQQTSVYDEALGFNVTVKGDNSMLFMIAGVTAVLVSVLFVLVYILNIKSAKKINSILKKGEKPPSFYEEMYSLLSSRFHITLMTLPIAGIVIFTVLPLIFMILIAFTNYDRNHQPPGNLFDWIGFENFSNMLYKSELLAGTFFPVLLWTL